MLRDAVSKCRVEPIFLSCIFLYQPSKTEQVNRGTDGSGHVGNVYITCGALWYNRSNVVRFPLFDTALQFLTECQFTHTRTHTKYTHPDIKPQYFIFSYSNKQEMSNTIQMKQMKEQIVRFPFCNTLKENQQQLLVIPAV